MTDRLDNPELDRLVETLNRAGSGRDDGPLGDSAEDRPAWSATGAAAPSEPHLPLGSRLEEVGHGVLRQALRAMAAARASDLLVLRGLPWIVRIDGQLRPLDTSLDPPAEVGALFTSHLDSRHRRLLLEKGATDFTLRIDSEESTDDAARRSETPRLSSGPDRGSTWRFRVNLHRQRGELAASVRSLPQQVPSLGELNLPASLASLADLHQGLIVVCGPTGSGKTSTLAALVGEINRRRSAHIITIEDPVEYRHAHDRSVVEQIEIGRDTPSCAEALRSALRQDPDVILVGEMRDLETISTAITAGETGHLILSTLHTRDAVQSIHRMVDVFPQGSQEQIRHQLSLSLQTILSQQLVPRADGRGRVPAIEILHATYPVRHHIRKQTLEKLYNEIVLGKRHGMMTFEQSLAHLVERGEITREEAQARARRPEEIESLLR